MTQMADLYLDISSVESGALPAELQESMVRHRRHVGDLADKMRAMGMDDDAIELGLTSSWKAIGANCRQPCAG
ncbi:hypothetical protein F7D01_10995 [Erythrobacter sp. 3-20A1M]|uniref:hypothetical protein n=1 Tax=Erythrobacter sp. 3-20A1M TaxID=2653850 RepID=UPI001BFC44B9|nr:hypothetical protein [Erythrobacter sp. 3-20A1M]QWC57533.1 hypothetical protein F7D01_10995 [Erythrobacter sp. 3-20A1M]